MSVETVTYISDLDYTQPLAADPRKQGDDHLRNIKLALRQTFPNVTGAVTATHSQLNTLSYLPVSVFDYFTSAQIADVQARTLLVDVSTAIITALSLNKYVYFPVGSYLVSGDLAIALSGAKVIGAGTTATIISVNTASRPCFTIATGLQNVEVAGMTITRTSTATSGGNGIECSTVSIGQAKIHDLIIEKQYRGLSLGPTDFSDVQNVIVQKCTDDGVYLTNTASDGAVQWSMRDVLSQMNAGRGFAVETIAGPSQVTLGTYSNIATFANSGRGIAYIGSVGVPINDIRMRGGFIGEDGDSEVYLDTYGKNHQLNDLFVELAGQRTTGPTLATAASATGSGIQTTANNTNVQISNCLSSANSLDGMHLSGVSHAISNPVCTNNGQAASAGRRNGIFLAAGRCTIVGGICSNTGAGTSQTYGVLNHDANSIAIIGADLNNNSTAGYGSNGSGPYITAIGNLPNTLNVGLAPQGAVLVGGAATGDWNAAGTINVAGGLLKNDTAYTNP